jgi:hypothetical protein
MDHGALDHRSHAETTNSDVNIVGPDSAGCTWVESRAAVSFGEHDTKHQALAQAVSEARRKAMHRFLGVSLGHRFIDFQQESSLKGEVSLTERLLRVTQHGRVLNERILWSGPQDVAGCPGCLFGIQIQTCIVPDRDNADRDFKVTLSLNRTRFVDGDEGALEVISTRDAYLYIYNVNLDWDAILMFPNDYAPNNKIVAGQSFSYPSEDLGRKGIKLIGVCT